MKDLRRKAPEPESDSQQVQAFLTQMEGLIARHPLWANSTPEELEIATEVGTMQTLVVVGRPQPDGSACDREMQLCMFQQRTKHLQAKFCKH